MTHPSKSSFDGTTLLRFVRGYATGAGLEYDVAMINRALCERHEIHIIQIHMARPGESLEPQEFQIGRGRVTTIPLLREILPVTHAKESNNKLKSYFRFCKHWVRDNILFNPLTESWTIQSAYRKQPTQKPGDVPGLGIKIREILNAKKVTMLLIHAGGGSDTWEAIHEARRLGLPTAMQLHFANERFRDYSVRVQVAQVDGIGGVSDVDVPTYLISRFTNLLTAIDLDFFSRRKAPFISRRFTRPTLILPARIVPTKGHDDLVDAVNILSTWGLAVDVIFAGRADQPEYENSLRQRISAANLEDSFHFLGLLNPEQLRDLYTTCHVLAFPTYHQEGLPRILLEAQAMELPVVVYNSGGSRAGMVPGKTGFLIEPGDVNGFADAIRRLVMDPDLANSYAKAGRIFVESNFGLDALADRHERFITKTLITASSHQDYSAY